jgi:hypothetical protein
MSETHPTRIVQTDLDDEDSMTKTLLESTATPPFTSFTAIQGPAHVYDDPFNPVGPAPASQAQLRRLSPTIQAKWALAAAEELSALSSKGVIGDPLSAEEIATTSVHTIGCNMIYTVKTADHEGRCRLKARLVARGDMEPFDPEERTASPTIIPAIIRMLAIVALTRQQLDRILPHVVDPTTITSADISTAFLNGNMKGKRINIRYRTADGHLVTAPLLRPLYGLRAAPMLWWEEFTKDVLEFGLKPFQLNPCVFSNDDKSILVGLHVDDLIVVASASLRDKLLNFLRSKYGRTGVNSWDMQDIPRTYCGVRWTYDKADHIFRFDQHDTITELLKDFGMDKPHTTRTPALPGTLLEKDSTASVDPRFQELVGRLLWISTQTRPDIAWAVKELCRHTLHTAAAHWVYARRVLAYLAASRGERLLLRAAPGLNMRAWADSSYAESDDRKSSSGVILTLGTSVIYWKSFTQTTVATSSCEAELNGFFEATMLVEFYRSCFSFLGHAQPDPTPTYVDSMSAIQLLAKRALTGRSKHVGVRYFHILDHIDRDSIRFQWVNTNIMVPDVLTKPLSWMLFQRCARQMLDGTIPLPTVLPRNTTGRNGALSAPASIQATSWRCVEASDKHVESSTTHGQERYGPWTENVKENLY